MEVDPSCPASQHFEIWKEDCCCEILAEVRAYEREQAAQRVADLFHPMAVLTKQQCVDAALGGEHRHSWERRYGEKTHHCECGVYLKDDDYGGEQA